MAGVNFSGFNGFDFGQIIDLTIQTESQPMQVLQQQQQSLQDKNSALSTVNASLGRIQAQAKALVASSAFSNVSATSSNTDVATVSAGTDGIPGRYDINVTRLAKAQVTASTPGYSSATSVAADGGSLSFTINGSTTPSIDVTSSTTLAGLRDAINAQQSGVVASIVNTGSASKLVLASRNTGLSNGFTVNNTLTNSVGTAMAFGSNSQDARDAALTVNGVDVTSASNTVADAIPGASINLVDVGASTIETRADYGGIKDAIKSLVSEYNKLRDYATAQKTLNASGKAGPLATDSILRQSLADIRNTLLGKQDNGGGYKYLSELGVEVLQTGQLQFTESKFNDAVAANPAGVQKLFQGASGGSGVFGLLNTRLDNLDGVNGVIKKTQDSISTTLTRYRDRIAAQQTRLDLRREELTKYYAAADQAMSKLNALSGQLSSLNK